MNQTTARGRAIATQQEGIDRNVARIEGERSRPTAIQAMAARLSLSPAKLQETLRSTFFREANDAEFAALIVVANEYRLNPLLKEIYAFKAKTGGIIPYVSVDGWIRIINEHPQFDGIEFNDIADEAGEIYAIECVIWRKDRNRPIKVTEYLDECRRDTGPWKQTPLRFLRHRSLMQCGRVAFGFSGIGDDTDYEVMPYGAEVEGARNITPPTRRETVNRDTGEFTTIDDDAAAELDRRSFAEMDGHTAREDEEPDDVESNREGPETGASEPVQDQEIPENREEENRSGEQRIPATEQQWATWWKGFKEKLDKVHTQTGLTRLRNKHQAIIDAAQHPWKAQIQDALFDAATDVEKLSGTDA